MSAGKPKTHGVLSGAEVKSIVGSVDDEIVLEILGTGASAEQVMEAFMRVSGNTSLGEDLERPADAIVLKVMEALTRDEDGEDER